ncbi:DUF6250 domain-containing protein [Pectobacterium actinidiae]|uniref:DUF6250 domain-containing protein n=1 Tax=Pectobacterium actinidiae TaxID=1507808 RepID=UPI0032EAA6DE
MPPPGGTLQDITMTDPSCTENTLLLSPQAGSTHEIIDSPHRSTFIWSTDSTGQPLRWQVEQEDPDRTAIQTTPERLTLESAAGLTIWLDAPLSSTYRIAFTREILVADRPYDRVSDLNQFWAARDLHHSNLFTRYGKLNEYDSLNLYYVGMGGNWNSTTRFRYYDGHGERLLLGEYTDAAHLLRPNHRYRIVIEVDRRETRFWVDDVLYFHASYPSTPAPGYFGFRTVFSRQEISEFNITPL